MPRIPVHAIQDTPAGGGDARATLANRGCNRLEIQSEVAVPAGPMLAAELAGQS